MSRAVRCYLSNTANTVLTANSLPNVKSSFLIENVLKFNFYGFISSGSVTICVPIGTLTRLVFSLARSHSFIEHVSYVMHVCDCDIRVNTMGISRLRTNFFPTNHKLMAIN